MGLSRQHAFVDETGDSGLDLRKSGTSSHFILAAVIVDEPNLPGVTLQVEAVRAKYFQTGEMKSSRLRGDDSRRLRVLRDLEGIDFHLFAVVVDKKRLSRSGGFRYHGPFVKFLSKQIHRALFAAFPGVSIMADEHGDRGFMDGFQSYMTKQLRPNLFEDYSLRFASSKSSVLLQLADVMAGTIARCFEARRTSPNSRELLRALQPKLTAIKEWPGDHESYMVDLSRQDPTTYNREISSFAIRLAREYVGAHEGDRLPVIQTRVRFLEFLLFKLRHDSPDEYTYTDEILDFLSGDDASPARAYYLRSQVVAPLRDQGVLIASSPKGYKIPVSEKDLYEFVNSSLRVIRPMLSRLKECRSQVLLATRNRLDLFDQPEYGVLHKLAESV